jgi:hypothetical protein
VRFYVRTYSHNHAQTILIVAAFDWHFGAHLFGRLANAWGLFYKMKKIANAVTLKQNTSTSLQQNRRLPSLIVATNY